MHLGYFTKTRYTGKILMAFLLSMVVCGLAPATDSRANAVPDEWDEVFSTDRAVLAKMPDGARVEATIKDSGLREAVLRAYRALKACAKVSKDQSRAIKQGTLAEFERAFKSIQTEAERSDYQTCAAKCKADGAKFEQDCASARKKLCARKLTEFGCFVTQCLFG
jgi:predicted lipid-binding transport protein (Tim44 family)